MYVYIYIYINYYILQKISQFIRINSFNISLNNVQTPV